MFFSITNTFLIIVIYNVSNELNLNGYDQLCSVGFRGGANLVNACLTFALFGPVVSCFIILGDMAVSVGGGTSNPHSGLIRNFTILAGSVLIIPIILRKNISVLKYVSPVALVALITFVIVLCIKCIQNPEP